MGTCFPPKGTSFAVARGTPILRSKPPEHKFGSEVETLLTGTHIKQQKGSYSNQPIGYYFTEFTNKWFPVCVYESL